MPSGGKAVYLVVYLLLIRFGAMLEALCCEVTCSNWRCSVRCNPKGGYEDFELRVYICRLNKIILGK